MRPGASALSEPAVLDVTRAGSKESNMRISKPTELKWPSVRTWSLMWDALVCEQLCLIYLQELETSALSNDPEGRQGKVRAAEFNLARHLGVLDATMEKWLAEGSSEDDAG